MLSLQIKKIGLLASALVLCLSLLMALPVSGDEKEPAAPAEIETEETTCPTDAVVPESVDPKNDHI